MDRRADGRELRSPRHTPSSESQNAPGIFDSLDGHDVQPTAIDSALS
jgi:hypothetical protein